MTSGVVRKPLHDPLLDAFSRDSGIPREVASAYMPEYRAWLTYRRLERLPVDYLLVVVRTLSRQERDDIARFAWVTSPRGGLRVRTAITVARQLAGPSGSAAAQATVMAAHLDPADQEAMTRSIVLPTRRGADQRALAGGDAVRLPTQGEARELGYELDPSSRPSAAPATAPPATAPPARIPWDGRDGAPGMAAARATMRAELFKAFDSYMKFMRPSTLARLAQPRVPFAPQGTGPTPGAGTAGGAGAAGSGAGTGPAAAARPAAAGGAAGPAAGGGAASGSQVARRPTTVVDIANEARAVLEARYATSMDVAAPTASQREGRAPRTTAAGQKNIFDPMNEADRLVMTGATDLAPGVAWWLFENDTPGATDPLGSRRFATEILASHRYSVQDAGAEAFRWSVANAYAAATTLSPPNRRQLIDYRLAGLSERGTRGITLQSAFEPGPDPGRSELAERWRIFHTATHESLHLRAHPAFVAAQRGRGTMVEGFTEMFTIATLNADVLPRVRAGTAEPLRRTVEGTLSPSKPDAALVTNRTTPTQYAEHRAQAERIRDGGTPPGGASHPGIGEAGVRAAYFQGHVEYLGLQPSGAQSATLSATAPVAVRIPAGINGLDELAYRSGVPRATIERDNPGISDALPARAVLAGCREHHVVQGESRPLIAAQHGVSEAALVRANPDVAFDRGTNNWVALAAGQRLLIPARMP